MKNLPFVLWMLFYPLTIELSSYLSYLRTHRTITNPNVMLVGTLICIFIWLFVGYKLYRSKNDD